jgi:hypothetical protein
VSQSFPCFAEPPIVVEEIFRNAAMRSEVQPPHPHIVLVSPPPFPPQREDNPLDAAVLYIASAPPKSSASNLNPCVRDGLNLLARTLSSVAFSPTPPADLLGFLSRIETILSSLPEPARKDGAENVFVVEQLLAVASAAHLAALGEHERAFDTVDATLPQPDAAVFKIRPVPSIGRVRKDCCSCGD